MGKRKRKRRQRADLPLFDLPLNATAEEAVSGPDKLDGSADPGPATPTTEPPVVDPEPPAEPAAEPAAQEPISAQGLASAKPARSLFEPAAPEASQLDRIGPGHGSKATEGSASDPIEEEPASGASATPDDPVDPVDPVDSGALLGDRLLGGLADLSAQLLMLGMAIAACHALGITVHLTDWQPFGVLLTAFSFLYWVVPLAFWGQTPGMAWVGHTARAIGGEPLTFSQTFRRWLGAVLTLALAGLPLLLALTGRSLTDRLSNAITRSG